MFTNKTFIALVAVIGMLGAASIADAKVIHKNVKGGSAYGLVIEEAPTNGGKVVNGVFIPKGTPTNMIPSGPHEDNYGSQAGKD